MTIWQRVTQLPMCGSEIRWLHIAVIFSQRSMPKPLLTSCLSVFLAPLSITCVRACVRTHTHTHTRAHARTHSVDYVSCLSKPCKSFCYMTSWAPVFMLLVRVLGMLVSRNPTFSPACLPRDVFKVHFPSSIRLTSARGQQRSVGEPKAG